MSLTDPAAMATAWLLAPALVMITASGIGLVVARISALSLGALTAPAGFVAGLLLMTVTLTLHLPPELGVLACIAVALGGLGMAAADARRAKQGKSRFSWRSPMLWAAAAALAAWLAGMAPLFGTGRLGVVGYVFNNDAAIHLTIIETIRDHGVTGLTDPLVSSEFAEKLYAGNYPLGSHVWTMFAAMVTGGRAMFIWAPLIAVMLALVALVSFSVLKDFKVPPAFAAIGAGLSATGYLMFSYLLQGSMKEITFAFAVYVTAAFLALAMRERFELRALIPVMLGAGSMLAVMSLGAVVWLLPAALVVAVGCFARPPEDLDRPTLAKRFAWLALGVVIVSLPLLVGAVDFANDQGSNIANDAQVGNLYGAVPLWEAFGIWFAIDYRGPTPDVWGGLNNILLWIASGLAILGVGVAVRRRQWALPLGLAAAVIGAYWISRGFSIYYQAKTYVVLAPMLGTAVAGGLAAIWVWRPAARWVSGGIGIVLAVAVVISCGATYSALWFTPDARYNELAVISDKIAGQGTVLVNDREDYARVWFDRNQTYHPWQTYVLGVDSLRDPAIGPDHSTTPDVDLYTDAVLAKADWFVDRQRPNGSHVPGDFDLVWSGANYSLWKRANAASRERLPIGDQSSWWSLPLNCNSAEVKRFIDRAGNREIRVSLGGATPIAPPLAERTVLGGFQPAPQPDQIARLTTNATVITRPQLKAGVTYVAYVRGTAVRGFEHYANNGLTGNFRDDLGIQSQWFNLGEFVAKGGGRDMSVLFGNSRRPWHAGWLRKDFLSGVVFVPKDDNRRVVTIDPGGLKRYCGERVDWLERL